MLFTTHCGACRTPGPSPCVACHTALRPAPALAAPAGASGAVAAFGYGGPARALIAALKFRNERAALHWLAAAVARRVEAEAVDVVTWAPTTAAHRRQRGFDQAELLARAVARALGRPCRRLLRRTGGSGQTGRGRGERLAHGPAFVARAAARGRRVLVIDDVVTTGATLSAATTALRAAGATAVWVAAVAATATNVPPATNVSTA